MVGRRAGGVLLLLALLFPALLLPGAARATEEMAERTGKDCSGCHVDPGGGGELNASGKEFLAAESAAGRAAPPSAARRAVRFTAGFLHLFTAVLWFGTILYVHLLLKPAYASRGLPRGELLLGWSCIVSIAVTGVVLTYLRIPSLDALFHTRFGILLTIKIGIFLVMAATAFLVTFVVGPRLKARREASPDKVELTPEELAAFTGENGTPALFAYKGIIYDASASRLWKGGVHLGKHKAGFDLTGALELAPHGEDRILRLPAVKKLVDTGTRPAKPPHLKGFYFMAYMNLFLVLAVLFIISLWRWW
ncbi:MAG: CopD family protein [Thermodesulfobacteriota bacterium]